MTIRSAGTYKKPTFLRQKQRFATIAPCIFKQINTALQKISAPNVKKISLPELSFLHNFETS